MKILLYHPPLEYDVPQSMRLESVGLGYIAAVLRQDGHEVEMLDAQISCMDPRQGIDEIKRREFDCLGITAAHAHKDVLIRTVRSVRKKKKQAIIAAGGYLPTLAGEELLRMLPELDLIVRGEGEDSASQVFGKIARSEDWQSSPGVGFIRDGEAVLNPLPPLIPDLSDLPFPARDALSQGNPLQAAVITARSCYHQCSFCCVQTFYRMSGKGAPRYRTPENVVDELEQVIASTGLSAFSFADNDFIGPGEKCRARAIRIAEEIRERKLRISFQIDSRADEIDRDVLLILKEAGLSRVFLGIESGVQRQLDTYNKKMTVEQNLKAIEMVRQCGIKLSTGYIMADPYTTMSEMLENQQFFRDNGLFEGPDSSPPAVRLLLFRGVPLVEKLKEDGLLIERGIDVDYRFKDPQMRIWWKVLSAMRKCSEIKSKLSGPKGKR